MDESLEGLAWLLAAIEANSSIMATLTGGVWPFQAAEGTPLPYCVVTPMGGHDVTAVAGYRLMWEGPYQVRLWGYATQSDALKSAGDALDALLQAQRHQTTPSGKAEVLSCLRDNPLPVLPEWDGNALRIGIGGLYRLQVHALS